jgi:outer membrane protein OmpA-like peptidoglycan-associated protein
MYGYEEQGTDNRFASRVVVGAVVVLALAALGWFVVRPALDEESATVVPSGPGPSTLPAVPTTPTSPPPSSTSTTTTTSTSTTVGPTTTATTAPVRTTTTAAGRTTTTTPGRTTTTAPGRTTTTVARPTTTTTEPRPYPTLPDGSPRPVLVIFDVETITLTGNVPTRADKRYAGDLALINSKYPDAEVINNLTINPSVPRNIGARVVELTSSRFPAGSAEVLPAHAAELDRVASVMNGLPKVTVLVVGHADQRGDEGQNYALSLERAQAVVQYLVGKGVAPARLSARAVGEQDLLSLNDDAAALALNRRTEFVFYGLLLE